MRLPLFIDELLPLLWFQSTHMVSLRPFGKLCPSRLQVILKFGIDLVLALTPVMYFNRAEKNSKNRVWWPHAVIHHLEVSPFELQDAVLEMRGMCMLAAYPNRILRSSCDGCPAICPTKGKEQLRHCKDEGATELKRSFLEITACLSQVLMVPLNPC